MREVMVYFMRGSPDAPRALETFKEKWAELVQMRADVRALVDPELIIMDVDWAPPATWAASLTRARGHLPNPVQGLCIPAIPSGSPVGIPAVPNVGVVGAAPPTGSGAAGGCGAAGGGAGGGGAGSGASDYAYYTAGVPKEAAVFGGYMSGRNSGNVRGFWQITVNAPPSYY